MGNLARIGRRSTLALALGGIYGVAYGAEGRRANSGRPHTDFIYSQVAFGRVLGPTNSRPGIATGIMAYDKGSGAITVMFRYPPGWVFDRTHYNDSDEEILILEGDLSVNDMSYTARTYAFLPAGLTRSSMRSKAGATVLTCYEGAHLNAFTTPPAGLYDAKRLMTGIQIDQLPWMPAEKMLAPSWSQSQMKTLRNDPQTGERTWLLKAGPDDPRRMTGRPAATHVAVQEIYVMEGEISTPRGVMRSGAFAWILPGQPFGPVGTRTGFTAWCRSKGGAPATTFAPRDTPIVWDAPYAPVIPEDMKSFAFNTFPATQRY